MKEKRRLSRTTLLVLCAGSSLLALRALASFRTAGRSVVGTESPAAAMFELTEHDFGVVAAGDPVTVLFPVRNPGGNRLVLTPEGCLGCAQNAGLETVFVPAGRSGEVVVTLETAGLSGDVREVVRYHTSDPERPVVEFVVTGKVERN